MLLPFVRSVENICYFFQTTVIKLGCKSQCLKKLVLNFSRVVEIAEIYLYFSSKCTKQNFGQFHSKPLLKARQIVNTAYV